jgi:hypothetical protein
MAKQKNPDTISLTSAQVEELKLKIEGNTPLSDADKDVFTGLLSSCLWLQSQLASSKITIAQLKQIFGISSEKKSPQNLETLIDKILMS